MSKQRKYGKMNEGKLAKVNIDFLEWVRTNPRYQGTSDNLATKRLYADLTTGKFVDEEIRARSSRMLKKIEDMIYGRK